MGKRAEVEDAVAEGCCWLAMCIMFWGQSTRPGLLVRWVRARHRLFTGWKPEQSLLLPGARLLTVKPYSQVVETQA